MNKIIYLDADFVIKTSKIKVDAYTLFDKILELPYLFRISNTVLTEIRFNLKNKLINLIANNQITIVHVSDCLNELKTVFDEQTVEHIALSSIHNISKEICGDCVLYNTYFKKLEANIELGDSLTHFSTEFENIIKCIPKDNNIGEIVTILCMSLTNRLVDTTVFSLLSHDSAARSYIMQLSENINAFDCYSCFYLLKTNSVLNYEEAKKYVNQWGKIFPNNMTVKIIENNSSKGINFLSFVILLYKNTNYNILRNGILVKIS